MFWKRAPPTQPALGVPVLYDADATASDAKPAAAAAPAPDTAPDFKSMYEHTKNALAMGRRNAALREAAAHAPHIAKIKSTFDDVFKRTVNDAARRGEDRVRIYASAFGMKEDAYERAITDHQMQAWMKACVAPFRLHGSAKNPAWSWNTKSFILVDF